MQIKCRTQYPPNKPRQTSSRLSQLGIQQCLDESFSMAASVSNGTQITNWSITTATDGFSQLTPVYAIKTTIRCLDISCHWSPRYSRTVHSGSSTRANCCVSFRSLNFHCFTNVLYFYLISSCHIWYVNTSRNTSTTRATEAEASSYICTLYYPLP